MILQAARLKKFQADFENRLHILQATPSIEAIEKLSDYSAAGGFHRAFFEFMGRHPSTAESDLFLGRAGDAVRTTEDGLIQRARDDAGFSAELREFWSAREDFAKLARLGDSASFELILDAARAGLAIEVDDGDAHASFQALVDFVEFTRESETHYEERVVDFFREGFASIARTARETDELINHTNFQKMAISYARLAPPDAAQVLAEQFAVAADEDQHYELNLVAGDIALLLSAYPQTDPQPLREFIANFSQYAGDAFLMKTQYALWLLAHDREGPLAFLRDPENRKSLEYAAAALADLHIPEGLSALGRLLADSVSNSDESAAAEAQSETPGAVQNPIVREALLEARARLENQSDPPAESDRMIHLFGTVTRTERALGAESDNVFLKRAEDRRARRLDQVLEVDDDGEADADQAAIGAGPLQSPELPSLRNATAEALREIDEQYDEILEIVLSTEQGPAARESALAILFALRPKTALADIEAILRSGPIELLLYLSQEILVSREDRETPRIASPFAVDWLAERLQNPEHEYDALVHLRRFEDERIPKLLMRSLDGRKNEVREALRSLGEQQAASAVPRIVSFLQSKNGQHVAAAAGALAKIGGDEAEAALADPENYAHLRALMQTLERRWVARAVGYYRDAGVREYLNSLLKHSDFDVRDGAREALERLDRTKPGEDSN